jgi:hypothetical protein
MKERLRRGKGGRIGAGARSKRRWVGVMLDRVFAPREEKGMSGGHACAEGGGVHVGGRGRLVPGQGQSRRRR